MNDLNQEEFESRGDIFPDEAVNFSDVLPRQFNRDGRVAVIGATWDRMWGGIV